MSGGQRLEHIPIFIKPQVQEVGDARILVNSKIQRVTFVGASL